MVGAVSALFCATKRESTYEFAARLAGPAQRIYPLGTANERMVQTMRVTDEHERLVLRQGDTGTFFEISENGDVLINARRGKLLLAHDGSMLKSTDGVTWQKVDGAKFSSAYTNGDVLQVTLPEGRA